MAASNDLSRWRLRDTANPNAGLEYREDSGLWLEIDRSAVPAGVFSALVEGAPAPTLTRAEIAGKYEDSAAKLLEGLGGVHAANLSPADAIALAGVSAQLAVSARLADLTERLGDYLGDDSNLDRLQQAFHDPQSGERVAEILGVR